MKNRFTFPIALLCLLYFASRVAAQQPKATKQLTIGSHVSEYPEVTWLKGTPVRAFEPGKTYIIECWATWCGPCMGAIPHLNQLHKKYGDKITIIGQGVMENDLKKVRNFVTQKGDEMAYSVAFAGGSESDFSKKWLIPAGVEGIPHTFVIQNNTIIWMPAPVELTEAAVELIISKEFSLEKIKQLSQNSEIKQATALFRNKEFDKALALTDKMLVAHASDEEAMGLKARILLGAGQQEKALAYLEAQHQEKLRPAIMLPYYRLLKERKAYDKLADVIRKDVDQALADQNTLIADVIIEGYQLYSDQKDFKGLADFNKGITDRASTSRPLFAIVGISPYYPGVAESKEVAASVFAAAKKHLEYDQIEFHYLNSAIKMFWKAGHHAYATVLLDASIAAGKKDGLPENRIQALKAVADGLKSGKLPTDEMFDKIEEAARR